MTSKTRNFTLGIFKVPTNLKQLRTALEAMEEFDSLDIGSYSEDDVLYPNTYSSTSKQLTVAGKQLTLTLATGHEGDIDDTYSHN